MTTPQDDNSWAFPRTGSAFSTQYGMTLRDYFAGQFIQGGDPQEFDIGSRREVAKYAYMMADAMLAARKEGE